jgi:hypothetical protein
MFGGAWMKKQDQIAAVIAALNHLEVKGKENATILVAAINTLEAVLKDFDRKEDAQNGNANRESRS